MPIRIVALLALTLLSCALARAQTPPSQAEVRGYAGLHAAAARGDAFEIGRLVASGENPNLQDSRSPTPLHVAVFFRHRDAAQALIGVGANVNALEADRYDGVTIASVQDDVAMLKLVLAAGANARAITSRYDGTALIAAAHLGNAEVVRVLIAAGAPLDHVNNLGWTALLEAVILGNGGANHTATLKALLDAGAEPNRADRQGLTALSHARARGYSEMVKLLEAAKAR